MKVIYFTAVFIVSALCVTNLPTDGISDMDLNTQEMALAHGYPCENYTVVTPDGYELTLFRIFGHRYEPPEEAKKYRRQPVLLQHGLADSSDLYVVNENPALGYMLADNNFDVWIGNFRGNKYARKHKTLDPKDSAFWDFSMDELIKYDLKTMFTHILEITKFEKICYAGHSMGGGSFLAAASRDPEFFSKHTKSYVGLAPSTRSLNSVYILRLAHYTKIINALQFLGVHEVFNFHDTVQSAFSFFCDNFADICSFFLKILADQHPDYDNEDKYAEFFNHYPSGTSTHLFIHIVQQSTHQGYYEYQRNSGDQLVEYDFTKFPSNIPVAIYAGGSDLLVSVKDTQWLRDELNTTGVVKEYDEFVGYGHATFIIPGKYFDPYYRAVSFFLSY